MSAPARRSSRLGYDDYEADDRFAYELMPGERAGPPMARRRSRAVLRALFLLIVFGGGWALLDDRAKLPDWVLARVSDQAAQLGRLVSGQVERAASAMAATSRPGRAERLPIEARPPSTPPEPAKSDIEPVATVVLAPSLTSSANPYAAVEAPSGPLPPPVADPSDPYRIRAEAVGLHPDLSRVLLARLSPDDYRNAGIAIRTAVTETPDDGVFVWPRQRKPELALFQVRFVAGAAPGCRRYVVTVTKDGWLTTALPMEKCGPKRETPGRG
jgi:hypothetical protein